MARQSIMLFVHVCIFRGQLCGICAFNVLSGREEARTGWGTKVRQKVRIQKHFFALIIAMGYKRRLGFGTFLTVLIVLAAIYYRNTDDILQKRLLTLLHGLETLENKYIITRKPKVAIGYGVCTDVFIDAKHLLGYSDEIGRPEHFDEINTELELLKSFAYYFRHGAAAE